MVLDMHDSGRRCNGYLLGLKHLLLEVLTVAQLVLLDRQAQSIVVVMAHGELIGCAHVMARLHHDCLTSILVM